MTVEKTGPAASVASADSDAFFDAVQPLLLQDDRPTVTLKLMTQSAGNRIGKLVRERVEADKVAIAYVRATATRVADGKFNPREVDVATREAAAVLSGPKTSAQVRSTIKALTLTRRRGAPPTPTEVREVITHSRSSEDIAVRVLCRTLAMTLTRANDGDNTLARSVVDAAEAMGDLLSQPDAVEICNLLTRFELTNSLGMQQLAERADPRNRADLGHFSAEDRSAMHLAEQKVQTEIAVGVCRRNTRTIVDQSRAWIAERLSDHVATYLPPRDPHPATRTRPKGRNTRPKPALDPAIAQQAAAGDVAAAAQARTALGPCSGPVADEWDAYLALILNGPLYASERWQKITNPTHEVLWNRAVFDDSQRFEKPLAYRHLESALAGETATPHTLLYALYLALGTSVSDEADEEDRAAARAFVVEWAPLVPEPRIVLAALAFGSTTTGEDVMAMRTAFGRWARLAQAPDPLPPLSKQFQKFKDRIESMRSDNRYPARWLRLMLIDVASRPNDKRAPFAASTVGAIEEQDDNIAQARLRYRQSLHLANRQARRAKANSWEMRAPLSGLWASAKEAVEFAGRRSDAALAHEVDNILAAFPEMDHHGELQRKVAVVIGHDSAPARGGISIRDASVEVPKPLLDLMPDIVTAGSVEAVADLRPRVEAAMLLAKTPSALADPARACLATIERLSSSVPAHELPRLTEELGRHVDELNRAIEAVGDQSLAALAGAIRRAGESAASEITDAPAPTVAVSAACVGISADTPRPELVVEITGPPDASLSDVRLQSPGQAPVRVGRLDAGSVRTVAIPIDGRTVGDTEATIVIDVFWTWGLASNRTAHFRLAAPVVSWDGLLANAGLSGKKLPDRLVTDLPLNEEQVQSGLFQGRADHLQFIRHEFGSGKTPSQPVCFHGIRKVGKSSLLRRILVELVHSGRHVIEVTASGIHPATTSLEDAVGILCTRLRSASKLDLEEVPARPDNPALFLERYLGLIAQHASDSDLAPVIVIDEFHCLYHEKAGPLLDVIRIMAETRRIGFVFAATEGPSGVPTSSNLLVMPRRVDFLDREDVERLIDAAFRDTPFFTPSDVRDTLFDAAAGHPNFTTLLAKEGLELANAGQRSVFCANDVDAAVAAVSEREHLFETSWFDRTILDGDTRQAAIDLAHSLGDKREWLSLDDTKSLLGEGALAMVHGMDSSYLLESDRSRENEIRIRIRGAVLEEFLRHQYGEHLLPSPDLGHSSVGLFCDIENVAMGAKDGPAVLAEKLATFAKRLGTLTIGEAVATSYSIGRIGWEMGDVERAFAVQGVRVQEPSRSLDGKASSADFVLSPLLSLTTEQYNLSEVVLVSGDHSFLGSAQVVLGDSSAAGRRVHVVSIGASRGRGWFTLQEERSLLCKVAGLDGPDLVLWDLQAIIDDPAGATPVTPLTFGTP